MNKETRTVHIPLELHTKLKIKSAKEKISMRDLVIKALEKTLEDEQMANKVDFLFDQVC